MNLWVDYNRKMNGVTTLKLKEEWFVLKSSDRHGWPIMRVGYARISSSSQELELQKLILSSVGCTKIYSESASGKDNNRVELMAMLESLRVGDVVVVYKIDRIARSLKGLIDIVGAIAPALSIAVIFCYDGAHWRPKLPRIFPKSK